MLTPSQQSYIDDIMDNFNFRRVHETMTALNWKWSCNGKPEVPEEWLLRKEARKNLTKVLTDPDMDSCGSGGLLAYKNNNSVGLSFELTSWEVDYLPDELEEGIYNA